MKEQSYRKSIFFSVIFHIIILSLFVVSFDFSKNYTFLNNSPNPQMIMRATVMPAPAPKPNPVPISQPQPMMQPPQPTIPTPTPMPTPVPQAKPIPQPVSKPVPVVKPLPPKKNVIALKVKKEKTDTKDMQKQILDELKKESLLEKKLKQKALEKSFESEIRNLSQQKTLLQQLQHEQSTDSNFEKMNGIIDKYRAMILEAVGHRWLIPSNTDKNAITKLMIRLEPGGMVVDVQIYQSSGNVALDNSARAAVFKASPLPVPPSLNEFVPFKQFVLVFRPKMFKQFD